MKRSLYILTIGLLLGVLLLTACQRDVLPSELPGSIRPVASSTDSSYINLEIVNGSTTNTTRATEAEENAIYDGILCIFEGSDEATATLKTATIIDQLINNPGASSNINITQRLATGTHAYNNNLYVLALLNTTSAGFRVNGTTLQFKNTAVLNSTYANIPDANSDGKITLSDIQALQIGSVGSPELHVGLFMSNAEQTGGGRMPLITTTGNNKHVYETEDDARANSANHLQIKVERAAARVKVTNNIPSGTVLSNITLIGATTTHPLIHKMTWTLNKYNTRAFAVGGGSSTGTPDHSFAPKDFTYFHQHALQSNDVLYVGPNSNTDTNDQTEDDDQTEVIVEIQLKDGSFLLGDCYSFTWDDESLYTTTEGLIDYFKDHWDTQKVYFEAIKTRTSDEVFRNTTVTIDANDQVKVTLTNSDFNTAEQAALSDLASTLSGLTRYFRNGTMYYTFKLSELERNNAYNLSLAEEGETDTRQVAVTFKFDQGGEGQTATFSNNTASLFESSSVALGYNMNYYGANSTFGQTLINPTAEHNSEGSNETDYLDFLIKPIAGWAFTPSRVSLNTTRYGTDGGYFDISWINSDGASSVSLENGVHPYRNNAIPNILEWSKDVTASSVGDGICGLRLKIYGLKETKQVGFSDIVIQGTLSKATSIADPKKSISGIGRATP